MNRRQMIAASLAAAAPLPARAAVRTRWTIRGSEGFDAIAFLGPLTGKPFYQRFYEAEVAEFRPRFPAEAQAALDGLQTAAEARGSLLWPLLANLLSAGPDATLADVIDTVDRAEAVVLPALKAEPEFDAEDWTALSLARPALQRVLAGLREADFPAFRRKWLEPKLAPRIAALGSYLAGRDVIAEQERLLGRRLDPGVEIVLMWFSKPHGVRVRGQRFLSHVDYPDDNVVRIAAHEILHPPLPMTGPAAKAALAVLAKDDLFTRIVAEHDPAFGYNSLEGLLNEDICQALDQIISERLGVARPAARRWAESDGGMHVLAAGLYGTFKADGYDETGGSLEVWLADAARSGKLLPARLHPAAAQVLGKPVGELWTKPKA